MLITVGEFCQRVDTDLNGLVTDLQELTGRYSPQEAKAWADSFRSLSPVLAHDRLAPYHMHVRGQSEREGVLVEYRLPASSSWADIVLLGRNETAPTAVFLELKNWNVSNDDQPGPTPGVIEHNGQLVLHPSEQVRGYVEYCQRFHSTVQDANAHVAGCVYMTGSDDASVYSLAPHHNLVQQYPVFTRTNTQPNEKFVDFLTSYLRKPDGDFAQEFEHGTYKQDRSFVELIAQQILDPTSSPFVLLDNQRFGFELCLARINQAMKATSGKVVIIIEGPPGSGKSVLAARLWAALAAAKDRPPGNVVITTTSASQKSNWEHLSSKVARTAAGAGIVKPANSYTPATTQWFGKYKESMTAEAWQQNLELVAQHHGAPRCADDTYLVSIVDEAHGLINPVVAKARPGVSGWPILAGPQAYHIIRSSRVSIFLMDSAQSFRDNETTTRVDIEQCAQLFSAHTSAPVSLEGSQYRCGGSKEYIEWLETLLGLKEPSDLDKDWRRSTSNPVGKMICDLVDTPMALESQLRECIASGRSVRFVSSYSQPWKTKPAKKEKGQPKNPSGSPHDLPADKHDFCFHFPTPTGRVTWSKIWNFVPGEGDYTWFIQAPKESRMHKDPLCEVGCPYTVRGFDYGFLGVLWCRDLVWRNGAWSFSLENVHESAWKQTIAAAKKEKAVPGMPSPAREELLRRLKIAYRILLSRAIHGVYIWIEDDETREYVRSQLP